MSLRDISIQINNAQKIGVTYHVSPDGDAVGSALALLNGLRVLGKDAYLISKDIISDSLQYLQCAGEGDGETIVPTKDTDMVVVLDCGNYERVSADLKKFRGELVNIDHHITNDYYGDINYVDTKAAATAEIVFELLELMGMDFNEQNENTLSVGTCLYTSIVTDTGAFRHSNVTFRTHTIAARLKKIGVNNTFIYTSLFDNKSFNKMKLIGKALSDMELLFDEKVALIQITESLVKDLGLLNHDTSDIISFGLQIKGVEIAVLIKEAEDGVKASLRAKNNFDVRKIAESLG
ncbi:MAG: DHH family phosphoesterase, partial [Clostridium sp.]